jgi:hypothetical protein
LDYIQPDRVHVILDGELEESMKDAVGSFLAKVEIEARRHLARMG